MDLAQEGKALSFEFSTQLLVRCAPHQRHISVPGIDLGEATECGVPCLICRPPASVLFLRFEVALNLCHTVMSLN